MSSSLRHASIVGLFVITAWAQSPGNDPQGPNRTQTLSKDKKPKPSKKAPSPADMKGSLAHQIDGRDYESKGIYVAEPKVYDDSLLQQMLVNAQAKLTGLSGLDQTGLTNRLGAITGATQQYSSLSLSVQSPSSTTPPNPTPQPPSTSLPANSQTSASDLLNEQLQLTYEIANLRLLLEGSLNDRAYRDKKFTIPKRRSTVGIPITISAPKRYRNAVAVVEVEVETAPPATDALDGKPPALISLLPREKTYNVAAITDKSKQIGGGFVTQVVSAGGNALRGRRTYYVVQDQDTLSLTFQPTNSCRVGFLWQFRPVLGQAYVKAGLKQTFVQLAFATAQDKNPIGTLYVRTYWRKYDRSTGQVGKVIKGSLNNSALNGADIANFDLAPKPKPMIVSNIEDLGGGQLEVTLDGPFTTGAGIRVGGTLMQDGTPGFQSTYRGLRFTASVNDLATKKVMVVGRDGSETAPQIEVDDESGKQAPPLAITGHKVTAVDEKTSRLEVTFNNIPSIHSPSPPEARPGRAFFLPLLFVIGGRAYGYSDLPLQRMDNSNTLSMVLDTATLIANPSVSVKPLFTSPRYWNSARLSVTEFGPGSQTEKMTLVQQGPDFVEFMLYGNRLSDAVVLGSGDVKPPQIQTYDDTLGRVHMTKDQIAQYKQLVIQRKGDARPTLVPLPAVDFKGSPEPGLQIKDTVAVGADQAVLSGSNLTEVKQVTFKGQTLQFTLSADKKSITISGLKAAGVTQKADALSLVVSSSSDSTVEVTVK